MMIRIHRLFSLLLLAVVALATMTCGDVVRQGRSPAYLTMNALRANGSSNPSTMHSDVLDTATVPCSVQAPCVFNDVAEAVLGVSMKDITVEPSTNNTVTINQYHIKYRRADGRNTQGVDVPFEFSGAVTLSIPVGATGIVSFEIVRHVAKRESPLAQLAQNSTVISTIADVTFFGQDQVGNEVAVTGSMLIDFGDF